ncbi:MAG: cytochrome b [Alphaproteobacteria bacterium]|nr:cytochrome b [Alphaproteobacteria bacterium SS10]
MASTTEANSNDRYNLVAIILHWVIALAIVLQLASGLWMVEAIKGGPNQALAYDAFQWHKSLGLTVLILSLMRFGWRLMNPPPPLPFGMKPWERVAAHATHWVFYGFMIGMPLTGWAMVSASPWDLPTIWFGLFEVPHIPWLYQLAAEAKEGVEALLKDVHAYFGYLGIALLLLHIGAALKHQFVARDGLLLRMVPRLRRTAINPPAMPSGDN